MDVDKKVMEVFKKYTPFVSKGSFNDKRVKIFIEDGSRFIKKYKGYFDVIIIDCNDSMGPSLPLFSPGFYENVYNALKTDGMMITLIGSFLDFDNLIKKKVSDCFVSAKFGFS